MHFSDAIQEYCFDCKVRKLSPKSISNYQKQLKYLQRYLEQPEFDADGFVVVKTKSQMEAEKAAVESQEQNAEEVLVESEAQSEETAA